MQEQYFYLQHNNIIGCYKWLLPRCHLSVPVKIATELLSVTVWVTCQKQTSLSSAFYFKGKSKLIPPNSKHLIEVPKAEE